MPRRPNYWKEYKRRPQRLLEAMQRLYGPHRLDENDQAVPVRAKAASKTPATGKQKRTQLPTQQAEAR